MLNPAGTRITSRAKSLLSFAQQFRIVLLALTFGDAERFPVRALPVFRQVHDLSEVVGVMCHLAVDGLQHGMRFAANRDRATQIVGMKRVDRLENQMPDRKSTRLNSSHLGISYA